jgi:integral membrane protein
MNLIKIFRWVAIAEGVSFLVLLGIAMPLKYFAGMPEAVKIIGMLHGILFVSFIVLAWSVMDQLQKKIQLVFSSGCAVFFAFWYFLPR